MDAVERAWPGPRVLDAILDAKEHRAAQPPIAVVNLEAGLHIEIKALAAHEQNVVGAAACSQVAFTRATAQCSQSWARRKDPPSLAPTCGTCNSEPPRRTRHLFRKLPRRIAPLLASLVARSPGRQSRGRLACSRGGSCQAARTRRALVGTPSLPCSGPNAGFPPGHALTLRSERPRLARPIGSDPPPDHWSPLSELAYESYPDDMHHGARHLS
eukprot:scaffold25995_cov70-Phaeocystis_antarctica.AAC.6